MNVIYFFGNASNIVEKKLRAMPMSVAARSCTWVAPTTHFYMGSGIAIEAGWFARLVSRSLAHQFAASSALSNHY